MGTQRWGWKTVCLAGCLVVAVVAAGCSGDKAGASGADKNKGGAAGTASGSNAAAAPTTPQRVKLDAEAIKKARVLVRDTCLQIGFMTDDELFEKSITGINNAHGKIDIEAALKALDVVAALPDHADNDFVQPISKSVAGIRESFELYKQALANGKPFTNNKADAEKMAKLAGDNYLNMMVASDESLKLVDPL